MFVSQQPEPEKPKQKIFCNKCGHYLTPTAQKMNDWNGSPRVCVFCDEMPTDVRMATMANSAVLFHQLMKGNLLPGMPYQQFYVWAQKLLQQCKVVQKHKLNQMALNNVYVERELDKKILAAIKLAARQRFEFALVMRLGGLVAMGVKPAYIQNFFDAVCGDMMGDMEFKLEEAA